MSTTNLILSVPELIKPDSCEHEIENIEREKEKCCLEEKEVDLLERIQSLTELEKCSLEEKLESSQRRCEEMEKRILQMGAKIQKFRHKKLSLKEKLDRSRRKCEELQRRNVEANDGFLQATDSRNLGYSGTKVDGENAVFAYPGSRPAYISSVAESKGSVQDSEGKGPEVTGASSLVSPRCYCNLKIINVIKNNLRKENLGIYEQMCFGNLLKINELIFQGQLLKLLLLHMDMKASNKENLVFNINNAYLEFGPREFFQITGLRFGTVERTRASSSIHRDIFQGRAKILIKDVEEAFLNVSHDHGGRRELTLKLALLYFLYGILLAQSHNKQIDVQYLHLVDDLQKFDTFPWGRVAYEFLVSFFLSARQGMDGSKVINVSLHGFSFALQVWAYEVMPSIAKICAARANNFENLTTRILRWSATKRFYFDNLKIFFTLDDEMLQSAQASPEQQEQSTSTDIDSIPQPIPDSSYYELLRNGSPPEKEAERARALIGDVGLVRAKLPHKLKKRRCVETENGTARYEEYID